MKVVVTGGGGFLGARLADALLARGEARLSSGERRAIDDLTLFDIGFSDDQRARLDGKATLLTGDMAEPDQVRALIDRDDIAVFHLASILSGGGEVDYDRCVKVNLDGGRALLDAMRAVGSRPRLFFTSTLAVYGGDDMPETVGDQVKPNPETTYGATKLALEALINDMSRKGFLDGRSARLPTIFIRPGKPNSAASSFVSGLFREPLAGLPCALPVGRSQRMPLLGYRNAIQCFLALHDLADDALGTDRAYTLPSLDLSVAEMIEALERVAAKRSLALGPIHDEPDGAVRAIVESWPTRTTTARADALGLPRDASVDAVIENFIDDYL